MFGFIDPEKDFKNTAQKQKWVGIRLLFLNRLKIEFLTLT